MTRHGKLLTHFKGYLIGRRYYKAQLALEVMLTSMDGMLRKDGITPVWAHSLAVAAYLRNLPIPDDQMEEILVVALLHDVVEDTSYPSASLKDTFGDATWQSVKLLTKFPGYDNKKIYTEMLQNPITCVVKGSDRINNQSTMVGVFTDEKVEKYIIETQEFVLPMLSKAKKLHPQYNEVFEGEKHIIQLQVDRELISRPELKEKYESN